MRAEPHTAFTSAEPYEPDIKPISVQMAAWLRATWRAWRNRRQVARLLSFDDRSLRDIGLTRSDVTGALALRASEDPSRRLARTVRERRAARQWARREHALLSTMEHTGSGTK